MGSEACAGAQDHTRPQETSANSLPGLLHDHTTLSLPWRVSQLGPPNPSFPASAALRGHAQPQLCRLRPRGSSRGGGRRGRAHRQHALSQSPARRPGPAWAPHSSHHCARGCRTARSRGAPDSPQPRWPEGSQLPGALSARTTWHLLQGRCGHHGVPPAVTRATVSPHPQGDKRLPRGPRVGGH